jgi:choline dehydrogenase-like flavoprotein
MGAAESNSVVDVRLKPYVLSALCIANASIMPTMPPGNTNEEAMMTGGKAVDIV